MILPQVFAVSVFQDNVHLPGLVLIHCRTRNAQQLITREGGEICKTFAFDTDGWTVEWVSMFTRDDYMRLFDSVQSDRSVKLPDDATLVMLEHSALPTITQTVSRSGAIITRREWAEEPSTPVIERPRRKLSCDLLETFFEACGYGRAEKFAFFMDGKRSCVVCGTELAGVAHLSCNGGCQSRLRNMVRLPKRSANTDKQRELHTRVAHLVDQIFDCLDHKSSSLEFWDLDGREKVTCLREALDLRPWSRKDSD